VHVTHTDRITTTILLEICFFEPCGILTVPAEHSKDLRKKTIEFVQGTGYAVINKNKETLKRGRKKSTPRAIAGIKTVKVMAIC